MKIFQLYYSAVDLQELGDKGIMDAGLINGEHLSEDFTNMEELNGIPSKKVILWYVFCIFLWLSYHGIKN